MACLKLVEVSGRLARLGRCRLGLGEQSARILAIGIESEFDVKIVHQMVLVRSSIWTKFCAGVGSQ